MSSLPASPGAPRSQIDPSPAAAPLSERLDLARRLRADQLTWYSDVHHRAELVLTLDSIGVGILGSVVAIKGPDIATIASVFGSDTWAFLGLAALSLLGSLAYALRSLHPAAFGRRKTAAEEAADELESAARRAGRLVLSWHFGDIARQPREFIEAIQNSDDQSELDALICQAIRLSARLAAKFQYVHISLILTALSVASLVGAGASYIVHSTV